MGGIIRPRPTATAGEKMDRIKECKTFTVTRYYKESDILVGAFADYEKAKASYEQTKTDISNGTFSWAIGACLVGWDNGKQIAFDGWSKTPTIKKEK